MNDPYSRLYHRFAKEFPEVWADDRALATWVRLLYIADASWPMEPPLPRSVRGKPLEMLTAAGLVTVIGECYSMRGLNAERQRRKDAAARAAGERWHSTRIADAMPRRTREEDEQKTNAPHSADADDDGREDIEAFLLVTRRPPTVKQRRLLDQVLALRDVSGPSWAANVILSNPDDPIGAVIREDKKWRDERIAEAKAREHRPVRRIQRRPSGLTGINAELAAIMRDAESKRGDAA